MKVTDRQRIERCLDGHPEDFGFLVERYQGVLRGFLRGRFGHDKNAEDMVQEAFVRAFVNLKKLSNPDHFYSWLIGIAHRVAQEQIRAEIKQRKLAKQKTRKQHNNSR